MLSLQESSSKIAIITMLMGLGTPSIALAQAVGQEDPAAIEDESGIDTIVVTSRFREESVQDIGGAIAALGSDDIQGRGIEDFDQLANQIAGLNVEDAGPNQNEISIRGISRSTITDASLGTSPLVTSYVDDLAITSYAATQKDLNTFDFNRVEVLKGPQPTFFGEGAVGGVVRYISNTPDLDSKGSFRISQTISHTDEGGVNHLTAAGGDVTLVDGVLGLSGSGYYRKDAGFIDNTFLDQDNVNDYESVGGNATLLWKPTEDLTAKGFVRYMSDELGDSFIVDGQFPDADNLTNTNPVESSFDDEFLMYGLRLDYETDYGTLTSISGRVSRDYSAFQFDPVNDAINALLMLPDRFALVVQDRDFDETFTSQELRFVSDLDGPFNFVTGGYYRDVDIDIFNGLIDAGSGLENALGTSIISTTETEQTREQFSGFVEGTLEVTDRLRLIAGVRYLNEELEIPNRVLSDEVSLLGSFVADPSQVFEFTLDEWLPRFAVEFDATDNILIYASRAEGVRNGGLNDPFTAQLGTTAPGETRTFEEILEFDQDGITSYELGFKSSLIDGSLILNGAVFYSDYEDTQVLETNPFGFVENGPDARVIGGEIETRIIFSDSISAYGSAAIIDAEFNEDPPFRGQTVADGNALPGIPDVQLAVGVDTSHPVPTLDAELIGHASFAYTDERFSDITNGPGRLLRSQELLNLSLGLRRDNLQATLFVDNALNDVEAATLQQQGLDAVGALPAAAANVTRPRTIGIRLGAEF